MYYKDTEMARNCNVFNDHQSLSRIIDARRGTGRLLSLFQKPYAAFFRSGRLYRKGSRCFAPVSRRSIN